MPCNFQNSPARYLLLSLFCRWRNGCPGSVLAKATSLFLCEVQMKPDCFTLLADELLMKDRNSLKPQGPWLCSWHNTGPQNTWSKKRVWPTWTTGERSRHFPRGPEGKIVFSWVHQGLVGRMHGWLASHYCPLHCRFYFVILTSSPGYREWRIWGDGTRWGREGGEGHPGTCQVLPGHIQANVSPAVPGSSGVSYLQSEPTFTVDVLRVFGTWQGYCT